MSMEVQKQGNLLLRGKNPQWPCLSKELESSEKCSRGWQLYSLLWLITGTWPLGKLMNQEWHLSQQMPFQLLIFIPFTAETKASLRGAKLHAGPHAHLINRVAPSVRKTLRRKRRCVKPVPQKQTVMKIEIRNCIRQTQHLTGRIGLFHGATKKLFS